MQSENPVQLGTFAVVCIPLHHSNTENFAFVRVRTICTKMMCDRHVFAVLHYRCSMFINSLSKYISKYIWNNYIPMCNSMHLMYSRHSLI